MPPKKKLPNLEEPKPKKSNNLFKYLGFVLIVIALASIFYESPNKKLPESSIRENPLSTSSGDEFSKFTGQVISWKSTLNDKEYLGKTIQTNHETTYHTFDFVTKQVIQKSSIDGKWISFTYPMLGFYEQKGIAATTYVIKVNQNGVKEIWFSLDVQNLGYDYSDGSRIACYELSRFR